MGSLHTIAFRKLIVPVANTWGDKDWTKATQKALTIIQVRDDTAWN